MKRQKTKHNLVLRFNLEHPLFATQCGSTPLQRRRGHHPEHHSKSWSSVGQLASKVIAGGHVFAFLCVRPILSMVLGRRLPLQKKSEFHLKLICNSSDLHCAECQTWNHCDKIHVDNQTATFPRKQPASWRKTVIDTSRKAFRVIEEGKY